MLKWKTVTKMDLVSLLERKGNLSREKALALVDGCFESIIQALYRDDRVEIRGLGSFRNKNYRSYRGQNPKTGKTIHVGAKKVPVFRAGKALKEAVKEGRKKFLIS